MFRCLAPLGSLYPVEQFFDFKQSAMIFFYFSADHFLLFPHNPGWGFEEASKEEATLIKLALKIMFKQQAKNSTNFLVTIPTYYFQVIMPFFSQFNHFAYHTTHIFFCNFFAEQQVRTISLYLI
jgi:hypothetical protein